jgi:hypothetical protein
LFLTGYGQRSRTSFVNTCIKRILDFDYKHENEAEGPFHIYWSKSKILFYACVEEGCSAPLKIARGKQT